MAQTKQALRSFVTNNFIFDQSNGSFCDDDSLLEKGIIDSTGVLELVEFLQKQYGIRIEDGEIVPENLDSINRLAAFVNRKVETQSETGYETV